MEFRILKTEFLRGLKLAQSIAERKSATPMLANVMIRTSGKGKILVAATDLNVSITAELKSTNSAEGGITINAKDLYGLISNAPADEIAFKKAENHHAEIKSGKAKYRLVGMSDRDFPKIPHTEQKSIPMDGAALRELIDRTLFAVCEDDNRFNLCGVFFESDGTTCRMVSADGHRMSLAERKAFGPVLEAGVIVPTKGAREIRKLIESAESVSVTVATPTIFASCDGITVATKLITAPYAPYRQALDAIAGHSKVITVDRAQLIDSLRRMQLMSSDDRGVKFDASKECLVMSCANSDKGDVSDEISCEYVGAASTIGFNARYMVDMLDVITSDQVTIAIGGDFDPAIVRPLGDPTYTGIAMPMRL